VKEIDTEPYYEEIEEPCFEVYFSFWSDPKTKPSQEGHRLVDENTDRIIEGLGDPVHFDPLAYDFFKPEYGEMESYTWSGVLGSNTAYVNLPYKHETSNLTQEQLQ